MKRDVSVIIERDEEGWFIGSVPEIPGCHTQAKTLDELMVRIREAAELCLEAAGQTITPMQFVGVQRLELDV
jgi:predicted RNase H-like HicB family nuclease